MKICPGCGVANSLENNECHVCATDFATYVSSGEIRERLLPACVNGELVFLTEEERAAREAQALHHEKMEAQQNDSTAIAEFFRSSKALPLYKTTMNGVALSAIRKHYFVFGLADNLVTAEHLRSALKMPLGAFVELTAKGIIEPETGDRYNIINVINSIAHECVEMRYRTKATKIDVLKSDLTGRRMRTLFSDTLQKTGAK